MGSNAGYQHSWDRDREQRNEAHSATMERLKAADQLRRSPPELDEVDLFIVDQLERCGIPSRPIDCWSEPEAMNHDYNRGPYRPSQDRIRAVVAPVAYCRAKYNAAFDFKAKKGIPFSAAKLTWWGLEVVAQVIALPRHRLPIETAQYERLLEIYERRMRP